MSVVNGAICATDQPYGDISSSSDFHYISTSGDTLRIITPRTPSSSTDDGYIGEICWDTDYIYLCTANNTWKRVALSTF